MQLTDNDPFKGISETQDAYRGQDGVKASDIIRPSENQTKLNVCFPGEDGARESEMRANYIPRDAVASRDEAAKIR